VPRPTRPGATTTTAPLTPITGANTSTVEFIVTGDSAVYSLTTTVNGQAETATNVALPWRRFQHEPGHPRLARRHDLTEI